MRFSFRLLIVLTALSVLAFQASAQISFPESISFQGTLVDIGGVPLPDDNYHLEFSIYNQKPSGGALIWGPRIYDSAGGVGHDSLVPAIGGRFSIILGPVDINGAPLSHAFTGVYPNNDLRFVEVTLVDGANRTAFPRQQILAAPYALSVIGMVPIGTILPFHMDMAGAADIESVTESGFALCNGTTAASQKVLNPVIAGVLPNLNLGDGIGRFLRGTTGTTGVTQEDQMQNHTHTFTNPDYSATTADHNHDASHPHSHEFNLSSSSGGDSHDAEGVSGGSINQRSTHGASDDDVNVQNAHLDIQVTKTSDGVVTAVDGSVTVDGGAPRVGPETRPVSMTVVWIMRVR